MVRIEQALRRLDGVVSTHAEVKTGTVAVAWAPGARLDLGRLKAQFFLWRGAVRCGSTTAAVIGLLRRDGEGWLLETSGTHQQFRLAPPSDKDRPARAVWTTLTTRAPDSTAHARVEGEVREGKTGDLTLVVGTAEVLP